MLGLELYDKCPSGAIAKPGKDAIVSNFGVVTSLEYRLHPVGPVLAGLVLHPFAKAREALQFYRDFSSATHEELTTYAGLLTSPEGAQVVAIGVCYTGPLAEGERLIAPVRRFGEC
jgi:hypothetical protein